MHPSSSLGIAAVDGCACFRQEILDDHQCVLHGTKALLTCRIVARANRQILPPVAGSAGAPGRRGYRPKAARRLRMISFEPGAKAKLVED
jgi:hypothetical protein